MCGYRSHLFEGRHLLASHQVGDILNRIDISKPLASGLIIGVRVRLGCQCVPSFRV